MLAFLNAGIPFFLAAEEAGGKWGLLKPDPGLIIWTVLTFLGLLVLLRLTAWRPIVDGLDRREEKIKSALAEAAKAREEGQALIAEQQAQLHQARKEAQKIIEQGATSAKAIQEEILAKAKDEAGQLVRTARREIELETEKARQVLRAEVVDLSLDVASRVLERSLKDADHERLAREFLGEVGKKR